MAIYDVSTTEKKAAPSLVAGGTLYADSPIGTILPYGGASAPSGWFLCDGSAVSRTTYAELFAVIGTAFGAGDGSTTFNLPDMTGKTTMGVETGHALGASEDGALPNIEGGLNVLCGVASPSDSFAYTGATTKRVGTNENSSGHQGQLDFDASRSSSIYTDGQTKVDPANVRVNYIIKAKMIGVPADFLAKVDEVNAPVVYEISDLTKGPAYVENPYNTVNITKSGKVVTVHVVIYVNSGGADKVILSGLPKANTLQYLLATITNSVSSVYKCSITENGELATNWGSQWPTNDTQFLFTGSYITSD